MPLITQKASSTVAVAQYDMLVNSIHRLSSNTRYIRGAGLGGSTAAGDCSVDLYVADVNVASLTNVVTTSGGPTGYELFPIGVYVPAGAELRAIVTDAAEATVVLTIELDDVAQSYY